jgi:uridine kinase
LLETLYHDILSAKQSQSTPLLVGIDGIDAAGKTHLGDQLFTCLQQAGYPVIRSTVDNFHNPREVRYQRGKLSPEGYYYDSFNYGMFKQCLLEPLSPNGNRQYRTAQFDHRGNAEDPSPLLTAGEDVILICDGIFLFRAELLPYWDVKIFVDIIFETCLQRALSRDLNLLGDRETIIRNYQQRYIPGQKLYFALEHPHEKADIIIDNNDYHHPRITFTKL